MRDSDLYAQRAEACRVEAEAATLENVRERCLRAGKAWAEMAHRAGRTELARDARDRKVEIDAMIEG